MAHHAYLYAGPREAGIAAARAFAADTLGLGADHPDIAVFEYGLFSVQDARRVGAYAAQGATRGDRTLTVLAAERIFHEAQNALLKLFEEPVPGATLVLVVPAEGTLLPTLRSRLIQLPGTSAPGAPEAGAFLAANDAARAKMVASLVKRSKDGTDEEKQEARAEAVRLMDGILRAAFAAHRASPGDLQLRALLRDLDRFMPLMYERAQPLKLAFEHLLLTVPATLRAE